MAKNQILTKFQKAVLKTIGQSDLARFFVWSGGTALSFFYLGHRLSVDLDFMSQDLFPDDYILVEIRKIAESLSIARIEERKYFNRHQFVLKRNNEVLKMEFIFYPFPSVKPPKKTKEFNIKVDSIEDIAINKVHAIYERSEPKDAFDLYWILKRRRIKFLSLFRQVEKKFGVRIDPVLFIGKTLKGIDSLDKITPLLLDKKLFKTQEIKNYFQKEAREYLRKQIKL